MIIIMMLVVIFHVIKKVRREIMSFSGLFWQFIRGVLCVMGD